MDADQDDPPTQDLISRHIFLFPFKWENGVDPEKADFSDKTDLGIFEEILIKPENSLIQKHGYRWERKAFELNHLNQYNEFNYYYDFVREVLYDLEGSEVEAEKGPLSSKQPGKSLLRHYELLNTDSTDQLNLTYAITTSMKPEPYQLSVDSVGLNVYDTGVGVLVFFLGNKKYTDPQDILNINQFGRRIAPPFFSIDKTKVGKTFDFGGDEDSLKVQLDATQKAELAKDIVLIKNGVQIRGKSKESPQPEKKPPNPSPNSFSQYWNQNKFKNGPFLLPDFISCFFQTGAIITQEHNWDLSKDKIYLKPVLDDRMFVLCWYGNDELAKKLKVDILYPFPNATYPYLANDFWYKFIFIDAGGSSCPHPELSKTLLKKHTYERWIGTDYATLYGVSRYSLVCLTSSLDTLGTSAFLAQYMESIYYKLFELSIVQRASVLRFADEVTHLSHFTEKEKDSGDLYEDLSRKTTNLYKNYIRFTNKIYFKEVTAQEQGIEMYDMLQKHMRIDSQVEDLDKDIEELHNYVRLLEADAETKRQKETASRLNTLTFLGALFLIPSFIVSMYGMGWYDSFLACSPPWLLILFIGSFIPLGYSIDKWIGAGFFSKKLDEKEDSKSGKKNMWSWFIGILVLILLSIPFWGIKKCPNQPMIIKKTVVTTSPLAIPHLADSIAVGNSDESLKETAKEFIDSSKVDTQNTSIKTQPNGK